MECVHCGASLRPTAKVCIRCGNPVRPAPGVGTPETTVSAVNDQTGPAPQADTALPPISAVQPPLGLARLAADLGSFPGIRDDLRLSPIVEAVDEAAERIDVSRIASPSRPSAQARLTPPLSAVEQSAQQTQALPAGLPQPAAAPPGGRGTGVPQALGFLLGGAALGALVVAAVLIFGFGDSGSTAAGSSSVTPVTEPRADAVQPPPDAGASPATDPAPPPSASTPEPADASAPPSDRITVEVLNQLLALASAQDWRGADRIVAMTPTTTYPAGDRKLGRELNQTGLDAFQRGDYEQAAMAFQRGVEASPNDIEIRGNLGFAHLRAGRLQRAMLLLADTLAMDPTRASSWANLAEAFAEDDKQPAAAAALLLTVHFSRNPAKTIEFLLAPDKVPSNRLRAVVASTAAQFEAVPPYGR